MHTLICWRPFDTEIPLLSTATHENSAAIYNLREISNLPSTVKLVMIA